MNTMKLLMLQLIIKTIYTGIYTHFKFNRFHRNDNTFGTPSLIMYCSSAMLLNNPKTVHPVNTKSTGAKLFWVRTVWYNMWMVSYCSDPKTGLAPLVYTSIHTVNLFKKIKLVRHLMSMKSSNIFYVCLRAGKTFSLHLIFLKFLLSHTGDCPLSSPCTNKKH